VGSEELVGGWPQGEPTKPPANLTRKRDGEN